jgi:hypothetical protein
MGAGVEFDAVHNAHPCRSGLARSGDDQRPHEGGTGGGAGCSLEGSEEGTRPDDHWKGTDAVVKAAYEFATQVAAMVTAMRQAAHFLRQIGVELTERGVRTASGGAWSADVVRQVILRAETAVGHVGLVGDSFLA